MTSPNNLWPYAAIHGEFLSCQILWHVARNVVTVGSAFKPPDFGVNSFTGEKLDDFEIICPKKVVQSPLPLPFLYELGLAADFWTVA